MRTQGQRHFYDHSNSGVTIATQMKQDQLTRMHNRSTICNGAQECMQIGWPFAPVQDVDIHWAPAAEDEFVLDRFDRGGKGLGNLIK